MLKSTLIVLGLVGANSVFGQMTLEDAVGKAIKTHPSVKAAGHAVKAANNNIKVAKGAFLPTVDLRVAGGREQSENSSVRADNDQHRNLTRFESSLTIRQSLYTGGRITSRLKQSKAQLSEESFNFLSQQELVALNAVEAYLEVLRNAELVKTSQKNVKAHSEILKMISSRQKEGIARKSDSIQVKGRLALAKAQLQRELANKEAVLERFQEAVGTPAKDLIPPNIALSKLPKALNIAQNISAQNHPEVKALSQVIKRRYSASKS